MQSGDSNAAPRTRNPRCGSIKVLSSNNCPQRYLLQKRPPRNTQKPAKMHVALSGEHAARVVRTSKRQQSIAKCQNSSVGISAVEQSALWNMLHGSTEHIHGTFIKISCNLHILKLYESHAAFTETIVWQMTKWM